MHNCEQPWLQEIEMRRISFPHPICSHLDTSRFSRIVSGVSHPKFLSNQISRAFDQVVSDHRLQTVSLDLFLDITLGINSRVQERERAREREGEREKEPWCTCVCVQMIMHGSF